MLLFTRTQSLGVILTIAASQNLQAQGWQALFNGYSLDGWTTQDGNRVSADAWKVEDSGVLHLDTSNGRGGNILSDREYGNFELLFEWKISEKGNNGIKYRVNEFDGRKLGIEYQVIDDAGSELKPTHKTASLYDVYESIEHDLLRPPGEWNRGRILVHGNSIEHWLNGRLVASAIVGSVEWKDRIAKSKFNDVKNFGTTPFGRIMITDHRDEVWYRNIFIREIGGHNASTVGTHCEAFPDCGVPACQPRTYPLRRRRLFGFFRRH